MSSILLNKSSALVSAEALQYIRPIEIEVKAYLLKPNTQVYVFLDETNVTQYFQPENGSIGDPLITSASGSLSAIFHVPGMMIHSGDKQLIITDNEAYSSSDVISKNSSIATTRFKSLSTLDQWSTQDSTDGQLSVRLIERRHESLQVSRPTDSLDPIVQSFFTYDISGGCFITSIGVYFSSKDDSTHPLPVWLEVRELINGIPATTPINQNAIVVLEPSQVNTSGETKFSFNDLLYLEENRDYCFIIQSMSNKYKLLSARLSEISRETGLQAFNTPYIGSVYRKEIGNVWTKKENESLKFKLYRARFTPNVTGSFDFSANSNYISINSSCLHTTFGSSEIIVGLQNRHGLVEGQSRINLRCDDIGVYNGFPGEILNNSFIVDRVISDYAFSFIVDGFIANHTGPIQNNGRVNNIQVDETGEGYTTTPTVSIIRTNSLDTTPDRLIIGESYTITSLGTTTDWSVITGSSDIDYTVGMSITPIRQGTGDGVLTLNVVEATAQAIIENGKLIGVRVTNSGSGYFSTPSIIISSQQRPLRGARATAMLDDVFYIKTNAIYNAVNPVINTLQPSGTLIDSNIRGVRAAFDGGLFVQGDQAGTFDFTLNSYNRIQSNLLLESSDNGVDSTKIGVKFYTTNPNVSPVVSAKSRALFIGNSINNQSLDIISSTNPSNQIDRVVVVSGGAGYSEVPTLVFKNSNGDILDVDSTVSIQGGRITEVTITNQNAILFDDIPTVSVIGGGTPTVIADLEVVMSSAGFNTELFSNNGRALSRYISKEQVLSNVSSGIRVYLLGYSNPSSSIDVYIKTLLSSSTDQSMKTTDWVQLLCNTPRNRSTRQNEKHEYVFGLDGLDGFDTYQLKIVLRTITPWDPPRVDNYRSIIIV